MKLNDIKKLNIPITAGCYKFVYKKDKIIYIGKAINLRSRVFSYWQKKTSHSPAKYSMLKHIVSIKWVLTDSEIEAILLEANLIKKYQPSYNVVLRDDKRFAYLKISTEEDWPRIFLTRKIEKTGKYFGPFTSVETIKIALKTIRKIWPFRTCKNLNQKTCLYYRIGKCPGVCENKISQKDYLVIVKQIILFLSNKKKKVVLDIKREIKVLEKKLKVSKKLSQKEDLEKKISIQKYQLTKLENILAHANVLGVADKYEADVVELAKVLGLPAVPSRIEGYDISNIFSKHRVGAMVVFQGGEPNKNEYRKFKIKSLNSFGDVDMLREVLERRFSHSIGLSKEGKKEWPLPDLIIIDGGKQQLGVANRILKKFNLTDISLISISKGNGLRSSAAPDKIFFPGQKDSLDLPIASPALHVIKRVRDEAHRFAISYHRKLRKNAMFYRS